MGILEVELTMGLGTAMDVYVREYEKRYKVKPVLENQYADQTVLRDLITKLGLDRTCDVIRTYLKMNEDWFIKKGHSLRILKENVNVINSKTAISTSVVPGKSLRVSRHEFCDKCKKQFLHVHESNEFPMPPFLCDKCS